MARYFFNVLNQHSGLNVVGEELPNNEAAWREATMIAGELKDIDGKFKPGQDWSLEVTDERRNPIYLINISGEEN
jgi:hypothetical protein